MAWMTQDWTMGQLNALVKKIGEKNAHAILGDKVKFSIVFETVASTLLTLLRTVRMPAQPAVTTSKQYFAEAGAKWFGNNFESQFLGLEVPVTDVAELAVRKLEQSSLDAPILTELGDKAETSVSQFKQFLADNRGSTEWFIFYLRGKDGRLWAVSASWVADGGGWYLGARSVESPGRGGAGDRVVSRN